MSFFEGMKISGSGLSANRKRIETISSNIANANVTRTAEGGPYRRKSVVFGSEPVRENFSDIVDEKLGNSLSTVQVVDIHSDDGPLKPSYEPNNPEADPNGFVYYPNINIASEMADMMSAQRSYEANANALNVAKSMALKALDIGKN